ncbi:hypothetical protein RIR_jg708.t2 [Rhizophagus irregularis DAOM 181602=DAOM 197198]|nr:hypothetical protein RIR_jg708.t2 [Rhizophagus irregularis DAOM 181602=DAOM 197198]
MRVNINKASYEFHMKIIPSYHTHILSLPLNKKICFSLTRKAGHAGLIIFQKRHYHDLLFGVWVGCILTSTKVKISELKRIQVIGS